MGKLPPRVNETSERTITAGVWGPETIRFSCGKCHQVLEVVALGNPPRAVGAQEAMKTHAEICPALAKERKAKQAIAAARRRR